MTTHSGGWGAAAFALICLSAAGARAAPPPSDTTVQGVTVESAPARQAERVVLERRVGAFVRTMTAQSYDEALTLWRDPVCPLVAGMAREQAEFILARLSQIASEAGAPLAPQKCRANLYIVASANADRLVRAWHAHDDGIFGHGRPYAVRRFIETPRPVRIWRNADLNSPDGVALAGGSMDIGNNEYGGLPATHFADDTRLSWNAVRNVSSAIVVVDVDRMAGINFGQLTDYIGMIGLTDVDTDLDVGDAPSILKLFAPTAPGAARPAGLSDWDRAYLKALYHTSQKLKLQSADIASNMVHDLLP